MTLLQWIHAELYKPVGIKRAYIITIVAMGSGKWNFPTALLWQTIPVLSAWVCRLLP